MYIEQAGRSLYERLEIAGMRNQLVRRAVDLKKNIAGNHRFLDILREMSAVVTENKMFNLNQSVDLNTQRMCQLSDSNERASCGKTKGHFKKCEFTLRKNIYSG